ncbi:MAG: type I glyceraldehyde-3-phosphate dehydrogenase [Caldisericales bacterium]|jgi:glyceraldehyde 3-phosphate dehydrogenase|nr:type I glyceraldehyde-3-phosphate dehydrogenase [Caldisericia bacterium]NMD13960.1 type I glyceraldehyde-3-phosphate dehydrogenase [Caldisericales bacterium]
MARIAINGFGRIGRQVYKAISEYFPQHDIVAVNDITDPETLVHLLKYDSNYGVYGHEITLEKDTFTCCGKQTRCLKILSPLELPWNEMKVDIVVESTGKFANGKDAKVHLDKGARKVMVSAPMKDPDYMILRGVNCDYYDPKIHHVVSNASCTTNSLAPVAKILHENFGILNGFMTTVHAYTNDQKILDAPHKDLRRARNAATNIIPTTTGAAEAVGKVIPELKGKMTGISLRVPTSVVSITDFVCTLEKQCSVEQINEKLEEASKGKLKGILGYSREPLVSSDYKGSAYSGIVDALSTMMVGNNMAKVLIWYDNEWGYSVRSAEVVDILATRGV